MNQHSIQEAYLKKFCAKGKLWSHNVKTKLAVMKTAKCCTTQVDFQPDIFEKMQNNTIESPGIKALNKVIGNMNITQDEFTLIRYWSALHCIRNQYFRSIPNVDYKVNYEKLMDIEMKFSYNFRYMYKHFCSKDEFLITSDNPVIELVVADTIVRVFSLSPKEALIMTPEIKEISHDSLNMTDTINTMIWMTAYNNVFSDRKELPYDDYVKNCNGWSYTLDEIKFI
jgi:hypothetical protein